MHDHDHGGSLTADPTVSRLLRGTVAVIALLTVIALAATWPDGSSTLAGGLEGQGDRVDATVVATRDIECAGGDFGTVGECVQVEFELDGGVASGSTGTLELYPESQAAVPLLAVGDDIVVIEYELGDTGEIAHTFADYQRSRPLILLVVLFVVAVVALGRFQGLRAIAGLIVSALVLFGYVFPALLDGGSPVVVALAAASVIAFAALYLAHGVSDTTTVALLGTLSALVLTGVLAALFTSAARITGLASEDQIYLLVSSEGIDLRGLVLAGIVLGSLGVLDDVTVTQVSAVARLREAKPEYGIGALYGDGVRIGRDHIASTVNTLVLAYAGASLPLLLFYANVGIGVSESITSEIIAVEIIRTLVGSIGLVAAVPATTALAAVVVTGTGLPGRRRRPAVAVSHVTDAGATGTGATWDDFGPDEVTPD